MKLKKLNSKLLSSLILISFIIPTSMVYANDNKLLSNNISLNEMNGIITPKSITGQKGPIRGYKRGNTVSRTRYDNFNTIGVASAFVGMLLGVSPKEALSTAGTVCWGIQSIGVGNVYYRRTEYKSPDGWKYYYKYEFYRDSGYNRKIGTAYSTVYGKWA